MLHLEVLTVIFILNIIFAKCQLYSNADNVTIFDPKSFAERFVNKQNGPWLIEFYSSYCGHCINFAPKFKNFLKEGRHWKNIIQFGVIDCSVYSSLCEEQGVDYYPFFKFYPDKSEGQKVDLDHSSLENFLKAVINVIDTHIKPRELIPVKLESEISTKIYFFIIGKSKISLQRTVLTYFDQLQYPIYYRLQDINPDYLATFVDETSRLEYRTKTLSSLYKWLDRLGRHVTESSLEPFSMVTTSPIKSKYNIAIPVYNQDIYSSIFYSFNNEISDMDLNNIDNVVILKKFVESLYLFSDISGPITASLKVLRNMLELKELFLKTRSPYVLRWDEMLEYSKLPVIKPFWIGCNGSLPYLRRFPCGLWTLFHTLVVNHHVKLENGEIKNDQSIELINSIRQFIFTFFKCRECAQNFKKETKNYQLNATDSAKTILYLWSVHNNVNKRLSRAPSEDPLFPKISFPSVTECPECRLDNATWPTKYQWNEGDVLDYLVYHYSNRVPLGQQ